MGPEAGPRRAVLVLQRHDASAAAPAGTTPAALARAALADTYEVVADLVDVAHGIAGDADVADLLWPGALHLPDVGVEALAALLADEFDELVCVPGDAPDLPGLVLAKVFKVLHRTDAVVAPARGIRGCVALGLRLPLAGWLAGQGLDLDADLARDLAAAAPGRGGYQSAPDWHRLRGPADLRRLDPGLEGWEETRLLLAGSGAGRW